ncbi:MAG: PTS sugar transporter subunit IIA [Bacteroidetes bacterium]|nr:PTS sugar transporter subunit IIA [Bacteroidota bacterium]MBU1678372.1 PTS sugar transporter subunit IIA [Bacteroidota bacterium]MBU2505355.1 PTS sugar transporter subunit IIA [Bacteroidota bacterium]
MKICDILNKNSILTDFVGKNKEEVINELIDSLKGDPRISDIEQVRTAVLEREKIMSTGVGKGFAIPHGKTNGINSMIAAFGVLKTPIAYEALDGEPVNIIFLLVGLEKAVGPHIKMLSRISRIMNKSEFRDQLAAAQNSEEIYSLFHEEEKNFLEIN